MQVEVVIEKLMPQVSTKPFPRTQQKSENMIFFWATKQYLYDKTIKGLFLTANKNGRFRVHLTCSTLYFQKHRRKLKRKRKFL